MGVDEYDSEDCCDVFREAVQWSSAAGMQDAPGLGC